MAALHDMTVTAAGGGNFLVQPGVGVMVWTLIAFGATLLILRKFAYPRIAAQLDKRRRAIVESMAELGLVVRAGLHTGECELVDGKVAGIAVHTGARVAANAQPGEVLVSSTVKDLVAGSGLSFEDRGTHELKGIPGHWRLYAVDRVTA